MTVRGTGSGTIEVRNVRGGETVAKITILPSTEWTTYQAEFTPKSGKQVLYFTFVGEGNVDFCEFLME